MNRHEQWLLRNAHKFEPINGIPMIPKNFGIMDFLAALGRWPEEAHERRVLRTEDGILALKAAKPAMGDKFAFEDRSMPIPKLVWRVEMHGTYEELAFFQSWVESGKWKSDLPTSPNKLPKASVGEEDEGWIGVSFAPPTPAVPALSMADVERMRTMLVNMEERALISFSGTLHDSAVEEE